MKRVLEVTAHRPWPLPEGAWVMRQDWCDLLFAHRPVAPEVLRPLVPPELELDLFDGEAWVGVVPFRMERIRFRGLPPIPGSSAFPELNVRTYVRVGDRPGVWFFSLDAFDRPAVWAARAWFRLPYFFARMACESDGDAVRYSSDRRACRWGPAASHRSRYRPVGPVDRAAPGSLEHWLSERYCLYALGRGGRVLRGEIHHEPWPLQPAEAEFERDEVAAAAGIALPDVAPLLHFARRIEVAIWPPRLVPDTP